MNYFNQISYLSKEVIASLQILCKRQFYVIVHFTLGRMTTVIIKLVEGNIKR